MNVLRKSQTIVLWHLRRRRRSHRTHAHYCMTLYINIIFFLILPVGTMGDATA